MKVSKHDGSLLIYCNRIYDRKEELSYEKKDMYITLRSCLQPVLL